MATGSSFSGTCRCWPILGGRGNVDDNWLDLPGGPYRAATLRSHDPASDTWAIWWLDGRHPGALEVPVRGGFRGDTGTFMAQDSLDGRPITVRFRWHRAARRWDQAFSPDSGASWEENWVMDFTPA